MMEILVQQGFSFWFTVVYGWLNLFIGFAVGRLMQ